MEAAMTTRIETGTRFGERPDRGGLLGAVGGAALALLVAAGIGAWLIAHGRDTATAVLPQAAPPTGMDAAARRAEPPMPVYLVGTPEEATALTAVLDAIVDAGGSPSTARSRSSRRAESG
jgi:hypothetical protein